MKILVTSDNHLGFKETDPIRAEDSFNTFEEVLSIASREGADLVLQGGDLFHENRPSRNTYNRTLQILKKYCLGSEKPRFEPNILPNTRDSNMNISLPIISIHGNHDDPSGFNSVSPHDVLHSSGFINYIGKVNDVEDIELIPILLSQGMRKVAIYGMGHIKDRRVYKTFMKGHVRYVKPEGEDWISILVVHQNRVFRPDEYLPEDLIDSFFDIVIYGHEHESVKIQHRSFDVIQCGSTVRTSLCEGETGDKYAYIIEIGDQVFINRIKLETVRPFIMDNLKIADGNPEEKIQKKMEDMLERLREDGGSTMLPLIRLRVDLEEKLNFNKHGILAFLESKIANPNESLRISRKPHKEMHKQSFIVRKNEIEDIYKDILDKCELKILLQNKVLESLLDFLNKDRKDAFSSLIKEGIQGIVDNVTLDDLTIETIDVVIRRARMGLSKDAIPVGFPEVQGMDNDHSMEGEIIGSTQISELFLAGQDSFSFKGSSIIHSKGDYTFLEDKVENIERKDVIEAVYKELEPNKKKNKLDDDSDSLLKFTNFI